MARSGPPGGVGGKKPTSNFGGHTPNTPRLNQPPKAPMRGPTGPVTVPPARRG
jgi:hypothetical protein